MKASYRSLDCFRLFILVRLISYFPFSLEFIISQMLGAQSLVIFKKKQICEKNYCLGFLDATARWISYLHWQGKIYQRR